MFFLVSYDIRDTKRLHKVAKLMERYGTRVQLSVFECHLSDKQFQQLQLFINKLINQEKDSVRFYRLCESCYKNITLLGLGSVSQEDFYFIA